MAWSGLTSAPARSVLPVQIRPQTGSVACVQRDWTILYVLDGDNDLREAATMDLVELHQEGTPENTAVIAQLYRGDLKWSLANFRKKVDSFFTGSRPAAVADDWRGMRVFEVRHHDNDATVELPYPSLSASPSPSDPQGLEDYLAWGMQEYPAKHYAVVLSGHGSSEGLLSDGVGDKMSFEQVGQAIKNASRKSGREVDVVLFDSCSTAGPQAQAAMAGATKFLVAADSRIKAGGWSEKATMRFLKDHHQATPRELAQSLMAGEHQAVTAPRMYDFTTN